jgi:hypothetical protein
MLTKENRRLGALRAHVTRTKRLLDSSKDTMQRHRLKLRLRVQERRVAEAEADIVSAQQQNVVNDFAARPAEPFALHDAALTAREHDVLRAMREIDEHQAHLSAARARLLALLDAGEVE